MLMRLALATLLRRRARTALTTAGVAVAAAMLLDMVMPGLSGPDVIEQIHAIDPGVIVIAVSGYDVEELFRRIAGHADTILRKPIEPSELLQAIASARVRRHT